MHLLPLVSESLNLMWPARCAACDETIPEAALFCAACSLALNPLVGVCPGCALPLRDDPRELMFAGKRCARCVHGALPFTSANAGFEYGETIAHAIVRMKHGKRRELARRLARLLVPTLAEVLARARMGVDDVVVPVPLHNRKLRERGFNQALELARRRAHRARRGRRGCGRARPAPAGTQPAAPHARDARRWATPGPAARLAEVAGAFVVSDTARVRDRRVLADRRRVHDGRDVQRVQQRPAARRRRRRRTSLALARAV